MRFLVLIALLVAGEAQAMVAYNSRNVVTPPNSDTIYNLALTANTAATVTWPAGAYYVNVNCPQPYWTSRQSGISVPSATVADGTGAALNSAQRAKGPTETAFYIISATTQVCSAEFWSN